MAAALIAIPFPRGRTRRELIHYTGQAGLDGITRTQELWATDIRFLNDSAEFAFARDKAVQVLDERLALCANDQVRRRLEDIKMFATSFAAVPTAHVFSMSEVADDLGQWRGYSRDARGYRLVFDGRILRKELLHRGAHLVRCEYDERSQRKLIATALDSVLGKTPPPIDAPDDHPRRLADGLGFTLIVTAMAPALKSDAFQAEREWRIVTLPSADEKFAREVRPGPSGLVPYARISIGKAFVRTLRSVIVGPMPDQAREKIAVERLLEQRHLGHVAVTLSRVPFRTW